MWKFNGRQVQHLAIWLSMVGISPPYKQTIDTAVFHFIIVDYMNAMANIHAAENKVSIVALGGLPPLIRQMMSPNVEVQCNAVGCITNLATHEDNKAKIARSGALSPLTRLAKSKDMRVQRNATGALLNMTHSGL